MYINHCNIDNFLNDRQTESNLEEENEIYCNNSERTYKFGRTFRARFNGHKRDRRSWELIDQNLFTLNFLNHLIQFYTCRWMLFNSRR